MRLLGNLESSLEHLRSLTGSLTTRIIPSNDIPIVSSKGVSRRDEDASPDPFQGTRTHGPSIPYVSHTNPERRILKGNQQEGTGHQYQSGNGGNCRLVKPVRSRKRVVEYLVRWRGSDSRVYVGRPPSRLPKDMLQQIPFNQGQVCGRNEPFAISSREFVKFGEKTGDSCYQVYGNIASSNTDTHNPRRVCDNAGMEEWSRAPKIAQVAP